MSPTNDQKRFAMGAWNPAGAVTRLFATEAERDQARAEMTRTGWITWTLADELSASDRPPAANPD